MNRDGSDMRELATFYRITWTHWDPSGRFIAFEAADPDQETTLRVVSVDAGGMHEVEGFSGLDQPQFKGWSPDGRWLTVSETVEWREYWVMPDILEAVSP